MLSPHLVLNATRLAPGQAAPRPPPRQGVSGMRSSALRCAPYSQPAHHPISLPQPGHIEEEGRQQLSTRASASPSSPAQSMPVLSAFTILTSQLLIFSPASSAQLMDNLSHAAPTSRPTAQIIDHPPSRPGYMKPPEEQLTDVKNAVRSSAPSLSETSSVKDLPPSHGHGNFMQDHLFLTPSSSDPTTRPTASPPSGHAWLMMSTTPSSPSIAASNLMPMMPMMDHSSATTSSASAFHEMSMMAAPPKPGCTPVPMRERAAAYGDLGGFSHRITTSSPTAQRLFDQGLLLTFGYNQQEALASFEAALSYDSQAPMLFWGRAYALGPFLNKAAAAPPLDNSYPVFTAEEHQAGQQAVQQGLALIKAELVSLEADSKQTNQQAQRIGLPSWLSSFLLLPESPQLDQKTSEKAALLERDKVYLEAMEAAYSSQTPYGPEWERGQQQAAAILENWASSSDGSGDADAPALAAEVLANLQPWDFWEANNPGQPKGGTLHILNLLQQSLDLDPNHPLALHLLIHLTESSDAATTGRALGAAQRLAKLYPTIGHLVHMPSHTFVHLGLWHDAVKVNQDALLLDKGHSDRCLAPDMPSHNISMLIHGATSGAEISTAREFAHQMAEYPALYGAGYMSEGKDRVIGPLVDLRFAEWKPLMSLTEQQLDQSSDGIMLPPTSLEFNSAMFHFLRSMGLSAASQGFLEKGDTEAAQAFLRKASEESLLLKAAANALPEDPITLPGQGLGVYSPGFKAVALHSAQVAEARLALLRQDLPTAERLLKAAMSVESSTGYTEPPRFFQPQAECLGLVLLRENKTEEAAFTYMVSLQELPRSPWALTGLSQALSLQIAASSDSSAPSSSRDGAETNKLISQLAEVQDLLEKVQEESKGKAVRLPSSCPAFTEPFLMEDASQ